MSRGDIHLSGAEVLAIRSLTSGGLTELVRAIDNGGWQVARERLGQLHIDDERVKAEKRMAFARGTRKSELFGTNASERERGFNIGIALTAATATP